MKHFVYIGMGSNADPVEHLRQGQMGLQTLLSDCLFSNCYQSKSRLDGHDYLNQVAGGTTDLPWQDLVLKLKKIEQGCNRTRCLGDVCTLDLDLLWYQGVVCEGILPHRDLTSRGYVVIPLLDLLNVAQMPRPDELAKVDPDMITSMRQLLQLVDLDTV